MWQIPTKRTSWPVFFTSGGTQSNLMGLLARGLGCGISTMATQSKNLTPEYASKLRILCSKKSHFTVQKSASTRARRSGSAALIPMQMAPDKARLARRRSESTLKLKVWFPFAVVGYGGHNRSRCYWWPGSDCRHRQPTRPLVPCRQCLRWRAYLK